MKYKFTSTRKKTVTAINVRTESHPLRVQKKGRQFNDFTLIKIGKWLAFIFFTELLFCDELVLKYFRILTSSTRTSYLYSVRIGKLYALAQNLSKPRIS